MALIEAAKDFNAAADGLCKQYQRGEQPAPTGNGRIVLFEAIAFANSYGHQHEWMCEQLLDRAMQGKTKYGTWLRANNGRDVLRDVLDEALDGLMYATQLNMEKPSYDAEELQRTFLEAAQICKVLIDGRPKPVQAFAELREKFGDCFNDWQDDADLPDGA